MHSVHKIDKNVYSPPVLFCTADAPLDVQSLSWGVLVSLSLRMYVKGTSSLLGALLVRLYDS